MSTVCAGGMFIITVDGSYIGNSDTSPQTVGGRGADRRHATRPLAYLCVDPASSDGDTPPAHTTPAHAMTGACDPASSAADTPPAQTDNRIHTMPAAPLACPYNVSLAWRTNAETALTATAAGCVRRPSGHVEDRKHG